MAQNVIHMYSATSASAGRLRGRTGKLGHSRDARSTSKSMMSLRRAIRQQLKIDDKINRRAHWSSKYSSKNTSIGLPRRPASARRERPMSADRRRRRKARPSSARRTLMSAVDNNILDTKNGYDAVMGSKAVSTLHDRPWAVSYTHLTLPTIYSV